MFYRFLESIDSLIGLTPCIVTAETGSIINNQLHGDAFLVANEINDIISSKLVQDKPNREDSNF